MPMPVNDALTLLKAAHARGRLAHAIMITGPDGSGKEELAANLIQLLNPPKSHGADLWGEPEPIEAKTLDQLIGEYVRVIRPVSKSRRISVEQIRDLEKPLYLSAPDGTWKIGIIVDADRMFDEPANAFLKTLEEPPRDTLLLLLTSQPERLLPTIHSRCLELSLNERKSIGELWAGRVTPLEAALRQLSKSGPDVWQALGLKSAFENILAEIKNELETRYTKELKEEEAIYKQASDGKWLDQQEDIMKAALSGELLGSRTSLMTWLQAWMGDALRQHAGHNRIALTSQKESTAAFGKHCELTDLIRRCEALRSMAANFETNAQDSLVLECGFLEAFA